MENFKTKDYYLASYLLSNDYELAGVERDKESFKDDFIFTIQKTDKCYHSIDKLLDTWEGQDGYKFKKILHSAKKIKNKIRECHQQK